jgi:hypothetical protein
MLFQEAVKDQSPTVDCGSTSQTIPRTRVPVGLPTLDDGSTPFALIAPGSSWLRTQSLDEPQKASEFQAGGSTVAMALTSFDARACCEAESRERTKAPGPGDSPNSSQWIQYP